jgi:hypothetical protein
VVALAAVVVLALVVLVVMLVVVLVVMLVVVMLVMVRGRRNALLSIRRARRATGHRIAGTAEREHRRERRNC